MFANLVQFCRKSCDLLVSFSYSFYDASCGDKIIHYALALYKLV